MARLHTHYDNLKVARDAPPEVISAAYKSLSKKFHPDRNPGDPKAAKIMSIINRSYQILSDPIRRKEHDLWIASKEREAEAERTRSNQQTTTNSETGSYQKHQQNQPKANTTNVEPPTPYLLPDDFLSKLLRNPVFYIIAGVALLIVASVPREIYLALFKYRPVEMASAKNANGAVNTKTSIPVTLSEDTLKNFAKSLATPTPEPSKEPTVTLPTKFTVKGDSDYTLPPPDIPIPTPRPVWVRPETAPNGLPWPTSASYLPGFRILNNDGHSEVTIDNSRNDSDVFVKLFSLQGRRPFPVRHFFIPAYGSFTLYFVSAGKYDVRYRDLTTGRLARSESFELEETETYYGVQYSRMTMTLYKVRNGNMETYPLSEDEF